MDRDQLTMLVNSAIANAERISARAPDADIVFVATPNVLPVLLSLGPVNMLQGRTDGHTYFHGRRLGIINERIEEPVFQAAVVGMIYGAWTQLNDIIVVDDEHRLFKFTHLQPAQYEDMGLTVRFEDGTGYATTAAASVGANTTIAASDVNFGDTIAAAAVFDDTVATIATDAANTIQVTPHIDVTVTDGRAYIGGVGGIAWTDIESVIQDNTATWWTRAPTTSDWTPFYSYEPVTQRKTRKKKTDDELSPGDTKLIDEFLDGFAVKGILGPV